MTDIRPPMNVQNRSAVGMDKFNKAPPGWSLTQPKGKWAWEKPPVHSDPAKAVDAIIDKLELPNVRTQMEKLMISGVSIQEITNTIAVGGFSQGHFTPDIAEIIKGPIAVYLMAIADEEDIPVKTYNTEDGTYNMDEGMDDDALMAVMKDRNPDLFQYMVSQAEEGDKEPEPTSEKGFIAISPEEIQEEEMI
tara:strand:+ start:210 stop:785 length:576 start_codon:yes stop_codon:yes gene_type:complete